MPEHRDAGLDRRRALATRLRAVVSRRGRGHRMSAAQEKAPAAGDATRAGGEATKPLTTSVLEESVIATPSAAPDATITVFESDTDAQGGRRPQTRADLIRALRTPESEDDGMLFPRGTPKKSLPMFS